MQNLMSLTDMDKIVTFSKDYLSIESKQTISAEIGCAQIRLNYFQVNSITQFHERLLGDALANTKLSWRFLFSTKAKYLLTFLLQQELELFCDQIEDKIYVHCDLNFTADEQMLLEIISMIISWSCTIKKVYVPENLIFHSENAAKIFSESLKELSHFIEKTR